MKARHAKTSEKDLVHPAKPVMFGDMVTADHMVLNEHDSSHDSKRFVVTCYDRATQWLEASPVASKDAHTTRAALRDFAGTCNPKLFYSDNAQELVQAAKSLEWRHDTGTDNRPQTNGVIERQNRNILEGTRASLCEAGLEHKFWSQAMQCWCTLINAPCVHDAGAKIPWQRRHGFRFPGKLIRFGAKTH